MIVPKLFEEFDPVETLEKFGWVRYREYRIVVAKTMGVYQIAKSAAVHRVTDQLSRQVKFTLRALQLQPSIKALKQKLATTPNNIRGNNITTLMSGSNTFPLRAQDLDGPIQYGVGVNLRLIANHQRRRGHPIRKSPNAVVQTGLYYHCQIRVRFMGRPPRRPWIQAGIVRHPPAPRSRPVLQCSRRSPLELDNSRSVSPTRTSLDPKPRATA